MVCSLSETMSTCGWWRGRYVSEVTEFGWAATLDSHRRGDDDYNCQLQSLARHLEGLRNQLGANLGLCN